MFKMLAEKIKNDLDGNLIWLSHINIEEDAKALNQFCALVDHRMTLTLIPRNNDMFDREKLFDTLIEGKQKDLKTLFEKAYTVFFLERIIILCQLLY